MKAKNSLRIKIIFGTVLAVSLLAAALVIIMIKVMDYLTDTILQETLRPMAKTAAMAVQGNLHLMADRISLIEDNDIFKDPGAGREEKRRILDRAESGIEFVWLGLYTADGELETGTPASPQSLAPYFVFAMQETKNLVISDTLYGSGNIPEIVMGTPVLSGEKIINYLVGSYKYDILNDVLDNLNISLNSTAYIVNEYGQFMVHKNRIRVRSGDSIFMDHPPGSALDEILAMMLRGQIDSARFDVGAAHKIFSFSPIRGTRWFLVIEAHKKDFATVIQGGIFAGVFIVLVLLSLFCVLANFFMARLLTEPLRVITENANDLNRGIVKRQIPEILIKRQDEIGQLARAFVSMSQSIEGVIGEIEKISHAAGTGKLDERAELSSMDGDFRRIVSGVNNALDVICSHLNAIPVALALFNENREMLYRNRAMDEFLLMHDLDDSEEGLLERIAGSGGFSSEFSLDPQAAVIFDPALTNPAPFITDIAILGHDGGSNFAMTIQRAGMNSHEKNSICVLLLLSDVTLLTRAKIDAEMASRTKSDFLSRMSHEIRTPMNAVTGMTQIAKTSEDMAKIRNCLEQIENSSNHLLGIINDILDFSKMESGKLLMDISEFSLSEDLDFVVSMMLPRARQRNIDIHLSVLDIHNDGLSADPLRLNQILINLLSNAIKFSPEGSDVFLTARELGAENDVSTYRFEVIDHGIGISEYQASKLFRPFEQADGSITRNYGGTGLGLAISRNLVEMMGGKISLNSKEGEGSTFTFTIRCPSKLKAEKAVSEFTLPSGGSYDFSGKRCLVVDDIEINREIILELLGSTNITLETAENGKQAADMFKTREDGYYNIILMDMQMPVMDGCTATEEIRRIEKQRSVDEQRKIPIVAMTANVMQEDIKRAMDAGMNAHLGKPIELETTLRTIYEQFTKHS